MAAGRAAVPKTCWATRSSSRNGSVRINMLSDLLSCDHNRTNLILITQLWSNCQLRYLVLVQVGTVSRAAERPHGTVSRVVARGVGGPEHRLAEPATPTREASPEASAPARAIGRRNRSTGTTPRMASRMPARTAPSRLASRRTRPVSRTALDQRRWRHHDHRSLRV